MLRLTGLVVMCLFLSSCGAQEPDGSQRPVTEGPDYKNYVSYTSFSKKVPSYKGEIFKFQQPIVVKLRAYPETPVRFYRSVKHHLMRTPTVFSLRGSLQAEDKTNGITLVAKIAEDGIKKYARHFDVDFDKSGLIIGERPDFDEMKNAASLGDLFTEPLLLPLPESGFVAGGLYGIGRESKKSRAQSRHILRGKTDYKGRQALVFDYRGNFGSGDGGLQLAGYRIIDVETGALLYQEIFQQLGKELAIRSVIDLDTSGWADVAGVQSQ